MAESSGIATGMKFFEVDLTLTRSTQYWFVRFPFCEKNPAALNIFQSHNLGTHAFFEEFLVGHFRDYAKIR